jgi:diguanylate cyclase (GGDEF)-like protein/PAS domain S-box-containing protein
VSADAERAATAPRPGDLLREWSRDWGGGIALASVAYTLAYLLWLALGGAAHPYRETVSDFARLPLAVAVTALAWRVSRAPTLAAPARRAWRRLSAGFTLYLLGTVAYCVYGATLGRKPFPSLADPFFLACYPTFVWALLSFPGDRRSRDDQLQFALDAATVMVSGAAAVWYFVLAPSAGGEHAVTPTTLLALAYPVGDLLLLFGATSVEWKRMTGGSSRALRLLAGAMLLIFVGDVSYGHFWLSGRYAALGGWAEAMWLVACTIAIASCQWQLRCAAREDTSGATAAAAPARFGLLPYAAIALGYALLLAGLRDHLTGRILGLIVCAVALTALVVGRQLLAVRENARLVSEAEARKSEARFRSLVQHSSDVITIVDADSTVRFASPSAERVLGHAPASLAGTRLLELVHPEDAAAVLAFLAAAAERPGDTPRASWRLRHQQGTWLHADNVGTNLLHDATVGGIVLTTRDVTEHKALEQQLTHQALHDPLTGLANRKLFRRRVAHALAREDHDAACVAVLFLDLDNFKTVNDSLGHAAGDRLLVAVAARLLNATRGCDTVARLGGDEFAILLENVRDEADAVRVAERVTASMRAPFDLEGKEVFAGTSIGIARGGEVKSAELLLRNADVAMYTAKTAGKGRHALFAPEMHTAVVERLELEADLRRGVERQEFALHYQPIVVLESGRIMGVEALVRWDHPERGLVAPADFIPLAEETGLIIPIGRWVLREACHQGQQWQLPLPGSDGGVPLTITVNISGRQLQHPGLVEEVAAALADSGLDPRRLVLEITESVTIQYTAAMLHKLHALKALGVRLAIDDFGTGYSSLGYLQHFPVDILKIDKAFIDGVGGGVDGSALARAIIALGDSLRVRTVAEGIEQASQLAELQRLGCQLGQGYYFAKPVAAEMIDALLAEDAAVGV